MKLLGLIIIYLVHNNIIKRGLQYIYYSSVIFIDYKLIVNHKFIHQENC